MKKLLLLGGSRYLKPVIEVAHKLGVYVITCDYLPDNVAHKESNEYWNISIVDKEAVLREAEKAQIDGIMSFACDPGVLTAAYVAERLHLPFQCSYESAEVLQDKGRFRKFLRENQFNCPESKRYTDKQIPVEDIRTFKWPVIVKPVDSAGSKGVTKVDSPDELSRAIEVALRYSNCGAFIVEEFLVFDGYHSDTDVFTIDGKLAFVTYSDQLFDETAGSPYVPAYIIWPSTMKQEYQLALTNEIQRLMNLLKVRTGLYNVEVCVSKGKPYIMELSPRGGGCKIAEIQKMAFGIELIEREVKAALGMRVEPIENTTCRGNWCEMVVHLNSGNGGSFEKILIDSEIENNYIRCKDIAVKQGDLVSPFVGANMALGDIFLRFETREELNEVLNSVDKWMQIKLM